MDKSSSPSPQAKRNIPLLAAHWAGCFFLYLGAIILAGGLLGATAYLILGAITHPELAVSYRLSKGFLNGCYYAGVWAGGLAMVLCVMRGWRRGNR